MSDHLAIKISSVSLPRVCEHARPRRTIAHFDVRLFDAIEVAGCALIRTEKDGLAIALPRDEKSQFSIRFMESAFHSAVCVAAREAYKALGGTDLPDWAKCASGARSENAGIA